MKPTRIGFVAATIVLFLLIGVEGTFAADGRSKAVPAAATVDLPVANPSFEGPDSSPDQPVSVLNNVPGWDLLPDSIVAVVNNSASGTVNPAGVDGSKILMIITGGVSQTLNTTLQPTTDYTFSLRALRRLDLPKLYPMQIEFVSNGRVLASCASHTNPNQSAVSADMEVVALTYRSGANNSAIGSPVEIRIKGGLPLPDGHSFGSSYADNARVTVSPSLSPGAASGSVCSTFQ